MQLFLTLLIFYPTSLYWRMLRSKLSTFQKDMHRYILLLASLFEMLLVQLQKTVKRIGLIWSFHEQFQLLNTGTVLKQDPRLPVQVESK